MKRPAGASHLPDRPNRNGSHEDHVMASKALPSPEVLRQLLRYEPETGKLFWRERGPEWFPSPKAHAVWNGRFAGAEALATDNGKGYRKGKIHGRDHSAHRVIWAMMTGAWPNEEVDHRDGDGQNNRWLNLREATRLQNMKNQRISRRSSSGIKGVSWHSGAKKWMAQISSNGRHSYLGLFDDKESAAEAYAVASALLHREFGRVA